MSAVGSSAPPQTQAGSPTTSSIEALLSARLFVEPRLGRGRITVVSNLSGRLSLYALDEGGSVPEPLLPPQIALQNPKLLGGEAFVMLPESDRILVMLDHDGDENYEPFFVPIDGGFPKPVAPEVFSAYRSHLMLVDEDAGIAYFAAESRSESLFSALRLDLENGEVETLAQSPYGAFPMTHSPDHSRVVCADQYLLGDTILYIPEAGGRTTVLGTPLDEREPGREYPSSGIQSAHWTPSGKGLLVVAAIFDDGGAPAYLDPARPGEVQPVELTGLAHEGIGELELLQRLDGDRYAAIFNIDGCTWAYDTRFDEGERRLAVERVLVGEGPLGGGVLHGLGFDKESGRFAVSFCTATEPTQLYVLDAGRQAKLTRERALGLAPELLSSGEDASYESHDGLRVSARLYLPSEQLGYEGARPLVYYIHGGPQGQERPDFSWFSLPLIQILTLEGFAVFVPNVRGSTGYGLDYTKRVDHDWGGLDRLDHVHAMEHVLTQDERVDVSRAGVVGRSYGGYMTLTLAARHPELWRAAVDMFGPYDLATFAARVPETWKPYIALTVGDPDTESDFLVERSPRTYVDGIACPLLVVQGQNDPRVVEQESRDLVEALRGRGKQVDYLVFEDEGHDVLKLPNRVRCYDTIVRFFGNHLG